MRTKFFVILCYLFSTSSYAQGEVVTRPLTTSSQLVTWLLSTLGVLAIILFVGYLLKKTRFVQARQGSLTIENQLYLGPKQRILLIKAGNKKLLVGVCPNQINYLTSLDDSKVEFEEVMNQSKKQNTDEISRSD